MVKTQPQYTLDDIGGMSHPELQTLCDRANAYDDLVDALAVLHNGQTLQMGAAYTSTDMCRLVRGLLHDSLLATLSPSKEVQE